MDGKYEINLIAFSLKAMSASKVAHQALVADGLKFLNIETQTSIVMDARERVRQLELPDTVIKAVEVLIGPLKRELMAWYRLSPEDPVFTPQGTVDYVESVRAIIANENMDVVTRFTLACDYCIEEVIFKMFDQLHLRDPHSAWHVALQKSNSSFVQFWVDAVLYKHSVSGCHLKGNAYDDGFKLALKEANDIAIRYFIDKADVENVGRFVSIWNLALPFLDDFPKISPSTCCLLFSKLSKSEREHDEYLYAHYMLKSLMNWPYQCFLTDHVLSLAKLLKPLEIVDLIKTLIEKIKNDERVINYHELLAICLEFHFKFDFNRHEVILEIARNLMMYKDEHLINIMLNKLDTSDKNMILRTFSNQMIFFELIDQMEFRLLKMFVRGCTLHNTCMLDKFKINFLKVDRKSFRYKSWYEIKQFEVKMQEFVKILDEIASEKLPLYELAQ